MKASLLSFDWLPVDKTALLICFLVSLWALVRLWGTYWRFQRLPPGPRGLPFIGSKHQVPSVKPWRKFEEWNKHYGTPSFSTRK